MSPNLLFSFVFVVLLATVSAGIIRDRRAIEDYWYTNGVVHNVVHDNMAGGPTSLGWAQVPHRLSPMFSPIFGGR
ncbi:Nematode Specific Peptide family, group E [Caenorhabditis elegans]|uniref:Nematode Specific Peptide family, group E n=1 Tax=Caenorhabditis elegans TaxID=6239 RepID=Q9NAJ6_CAEEL|nr:Nematode Specific Peptide family, group E [Caenorhabditis elegans]CAB54406.1 Nematode Specific Peptide family, group E [Caenorhabditis elegans]|eukprot:NP_496698.1 Nematode Specific Peptide family, group E [Caenorhabditis elegans]